MNSQKLATPKSKNSLPNPQVGTHNPQKSPYLTQIQTSHSQKERRSAKESQNNHEQSMNTFFALKKLKQTEQSISMVKGRFKIFKIKQQNSRAKTIHYQNTLKFNQQTQKYKSQHKADLMNTYKQRQAQVAQIRNKNNKFRKELREKNRQIKNNIVQQRIQQNKIIKKQSIQNEKKFKEIKMEDRKEKYQKRNKVYQEQRLQKLRLDRYKQSRINQTKQSKNLDMNELLERQNAKQKELQELIKIQQQVEKQAMHSIEASRVLKVKLQSVIERRKLKGNQSQLSQTSQIRLPDIHKINDKNFDSINRSTVIS